MTHPRSPLDYSTERLRQTKNAWTRLRNTIANASANAQSTLDSQTASPAAQVLEERFTAALSDDLNTPEALAAVFDMVSEWNRTQEPALAVSARRALEMLGFTLEEQEFTGDDLTPGLVELLIEVRREARERRDFAASDTIRDELAQMGITLEDTPEGTRWRHGGHE
jgi:cysteinyl-tRNA synthetase